MYSSNTKGNEMDNEIKIDDISYVVSNLGNVKLNNLLYSPAFFIALQAHLNRESSLDVDRLLDNYETTSIKKEDLITLCRLIDCLFREDKSYNPILKNELIDINYEVSSLYDKDGLKTSLVIRTNFADFEDLFEEILKPYICFEKIGNYKYVIKACFPSDDGYIPKEDIFNFVKLEDAEYSFYIEEMEVDSLINILYSISKEFNAIVNSISLYKDISLLIDIIPKEFKNIRINKILTDREIIDLLGDNEITKLSQLNKMDFKILNNNCLNFLFDTLLHSCFILPKELQTAITTGLKDKFQKYVEMRYKDGLKYTEMAEKLGITRAGAQSSCSKVEKLIKDNFNKNIKINDQIYLFRDNDYFIYENKLRKLGLWIPFVTDICGIHRYKDSDIFTFENYKSLKDGDIEASETIQKEYFNFLCLLPNIIEKKEVNKYITYIIENSENFINRQDIRKIIELNYFDYGIILSKSKLDTNYFFKYIIENFYPEGLNVYDKANLENIKALLKDLFNYESDALSDRYISSRIPKLCTLVGRGVWKYNVNVELTTEMKSRINDFISSYPIAAVPINSIYEQFAEELLEYGIENKYSLQGILRKIIDPKFKATKDYIYTDDNQTFVESIAEFIKNSKILVTKEILEKTFPGFQVGTMQRVIATTPIVNMNGYYASIDNMDISDEEKSLLQEEINIVVEDAKAHNLKNIFFRFKKKFNGLFNRIGIMHYLQLYYILNKLFDDDFEFLRPFIAKKRVEILDKERQLIEKITAEGEVTRDRLRTLCYEVGFFMESIMDFVIRNNDEILFKSEDVIVCAEKFDIDEEKLQNIDTILDRSMLYSEYKYLRDVMEFNEIKELHDEMNEWLLYSLISIYSTKYKVYRTDNVISRTKLILSNENFDISQIESLPASGAETFDPEDLLDIEDLED